MIEKLSDEQLEELKARHTALCEEHLARTLLCQRERLVL